MPLLTVVVPVYNVEKYLYSCIESILRQSFTDFELILVDDGSSDKSGEICDKYALKDERIIVIHKLNSGVSSARNVALDIAKGKYVTFVDSDDTISADFAVNIEYAEANPHIDWILIPMKVICFDKVIFHNTTESSILSEAKEVYSFLLERMEKVGPFCTGNIYRRDCYFNGDNGLRFPLNQNFEDKSLFLPMISRTTCLYISIQGMYYYRIRENSITTSQFALDKYIDSFKSEIDVFNGICAMSKTLSLNKYKCIHYLKAVRYAQAIGMSRKGYIKQWAQLNDEIVLTWEDIGIGPINKTWFRLVACWIMGFVRYCQITTWLLRQKKKIKNF